MTPRAITRPRLDEQDLRLLPKAEVHVHLEGTFSLADLLALARENKAPLPGPARKLFDLSTHAEAQATGIVREGAAGAGAKGLGGFLAFLDWQCSLVQTPEQAARVGYAAAARQSASGIRYSDVIVNPTHWRSWRGRELELLDAIGHGFDEAEQDGLCVANICYSLLRTQSGQEADDIVAALAERRPTRVIALSIDGDESATGRTGARFSAAFTRAAASGIRRTVHAGESSGPEGVWDAIDLLHAERVDHGVRSIEDARLVDELAVRGVSLGVCPRSNIALGLYADWPSHPLPLLLEAGVAVTLNTDDPAPLGTTLETDWAVAAAEFGFDHHDMVGFAKRSIVASFADDDLKRDLLAELTASELTTLDSQDAG
jgi:adenosine deaminase